MGDALTAALLSNLLLGRGGVGGSSGRRSGGSRKRRTSRRKLKWPWVSKSKKCPKGYRTMKKTSRGRKCGKNRSAYERAWYKAKRGDDIAYRVRSDPAFGLAEGPLNMPPGYTAPVFDDEGKSLTKEEKRQLRRADRERRHRDRREEKHKRERHERKKRPLVESPKASVRLSPSSVLADSKRLRTDADPEWGSDLEETDL